MTQATITQLPGMRFTAKGLDVSFSNPNAKPAAPPQAICEDRAQADAAISLMLASGKATHPAAVESVTIVHEFATAEGPRFLAGVAFGVLPPTTEELAAAQEFLQRAGRGEPFSMPTSEDAEAKRLNEASRSSCCAANFLKRLGRGTLPLIVNDPAHAHRHLLRTHTGAQIVSRSLQVVNEAVMVPAVIRELIRRGETEHPDALESVVIVSEMYDDKHNVIAGVVAVALAHALPPPEPRQDLLGLLDGRRRG